MKKETRLVIMAIFLMILMGIYKPLIKEFAPFLDKDAAKLLQKLLQAITVMIFISRLKLWGCIGKLAKAPKQVMLLMLPIAIISFIPLFNGINVKDVDKIFILIITSLLIGVIEEFIFRGVVFSALMSSGVKTAILGSSVLFGLIHLLNLVYGADLLDTFVQIVFAFGFGLVMASIRYKYNVILPLILVHGLWDFNDSVASNNFSGIIDVIHTVGLLLVIVWGIVITTMILKAENKIEA